MEWLDQCVMPKCTGTMCKSGLYDLYCNLCGTPAKNDTIIGVPVDENDTISTPDDSIKKYETMEEIYGDNNTVEGNVRELIYDHKAARDKINPPHYKKGNIEVFDYILEVTKDLPGNEAACVTNILKYVSRYKQKNGVEDIKKMLWYGNKLVEILGEENVL